MHVLTSALSTSAAFINRWSCLLSETATTNRLRTISIDSDSGLWHMPLLMVSSHQSSTCSNLLPGIGLFSNRARCFVGTDMHPLAETNTQATSLVLCSPPCRREYSAGPAWAPHASAEDWPAKQEAAVADLLHGVIDRTLGNRTATQRL